MVPPGERAQVRFQANDDEIEGLDWFGDAEFIQIR
jgi:hypothetical protein